MREIRRRKENKTATIKCIIRFAFPTTALLGIGNTLFLTYTGNVHYNSLLLLGK